MKSIHTYDNILLNKKTIFLDNSSKCGVYKWTNKQSKKIYIGCSINLSRRLKNYLSIGYISNENKTKKSKIYESLIKEGYSSFKLDILEYCNPSVLTLREKYYLNLLNPEYNILKPIKDIEFFLFQKESIKLMLKHRTGKYKPWKVIVLNLETKEELYLESMTEAAKYIGVHKSGISKSFSEKGLYLNKKYKIIKYYN